MTGAGRSPGTGGLIHPGAAIIDGATGARIAGARLADGVENSAAEHDQLPRGAVFVRVGMDVPSVLRYLGAWSAGHPVALLDPALAATTLLDLVARYLPSTVLGVADEEPPAGYHPRTLTVNGPAWVRDDAIDVPAIHADLGVLLATSGSTGDPKLVRLSRAAIVHNAQSIAAALRLTPDEVAPTCLPLFYSYGMSVLNSHLATGATVAVVDGGVLSRDFWGAFDAHRATSLSGVPYHYEMLTRIRWNPARHPTLRTLTQAGGRMRPELVDTFHKSIRAVGGGLYVMYGQTEAAPRIATLPAEDLPAKLGSVGPALPGGRLSVLADDSPPADGAHETGEIIYHGPNVMMGYAEAAADLTRPDDCVARLATGDVGYVDGDGYLWLTGRLKRIGKIFGIRVNLDDIERLLKEYGPVAVVPAGDGVIIWCEEGDAPTRAAMIQLAAERLKLHRSGFAVRALDRLPLLSNGKIDYRALEAT